MKIPKKFQRIWVWLERQNGTFRPSILLSASQDSQILENHKLLKKSGYRIFVENSDQISEENEKVKDRKKIY